MTVMPAIDTHDHAGAELQRRPGYADSAASGAAPSGPLGLCLDCGYALVGLPTPRCPECGRAFDPLDPATMNMGRELSELAKWVLGPVRWPVSYATWGAMLVALWYARLPGGQIAGSASLKILIALGALWLTWPLVRLAAARKYGWPHSLVMRGQRLRLTVGVTMMLAALAIWRQLPMRAALKISRPAMDQVVADLKTSGGPYLDDRRVGVYHARRIKTVPGDGVRFTVEESNRAYRSGFIYLPHADPKRATRRSYQYVGDGWWAWREEG